MTFLPARIPDIKHKDSVTEEEARLIWNNAAKPSTRILVKLLWCTGLRITEALSLTPANFQTKEQNVWLNVMTEKVGLKPNSKPDIMPIPRNLAWDLFEYIKDRGIRPSQKLFNFHRSTAWRQIQHAARDAGIPHWKDIHPHSFRHGFIYDKATKGVSPYILSRLARHRDLNTTLGYYEPTEQDLQRAIET